MKKARDLNQRWRTAVVRVRLDEAAYRRAHQAAHANAGIWNNAVAWLRTMWDDNPGITIDAYGIKAYILTLTRDERPVHTHTAQEIAFDLHDAVVTYRANRNQGRKARAPWRHKNYRPLSFTRGYGWRITQPATPAPSATGGVLNLSLGAGRPGIQVPVPTVTDPATGQVVDPVLWGEIRLCWDLDAREWSLHIAVPTRPPVPLNPDRVVAIDEGIINPMTLAVRQDDGTIDVLVINGREARAIKRERNKKIGQLTRAQSRCADGSRRKKRLQAVKKKTRARANARLLDFNHQVTAKATRFIQTHDTGQIVIGDVRGIERDTRARQRASRSTRQQLSQWERGTQEGYLAHKTGVTPTHINEAYSSQTCPACLTRNRPNGRTYRCRVRTQPNGSTTGCGFTCHRDAVGAINILMRAIHGNYTRLDPTALTPQGIRVTYLRAVPRWSPAQRANHSRKQATTGATPRSKAQNRATQPVPPPPPGNARNHGNHQTSCGETDSAPTNPCATNPAPANAPTGDGPQATAA